MNTYRIPRRGEWTVDALNLLPKDGHVLEVIDGELDVVPPPDEAHDRVLWNILLSLMPFATQQRWGIDVRPAPITFSPRRHVHPDLILSPHPSFAPAPFHLIVEVASPHSRRTDTGAKRELYLQERVWEYWILDSDRRELVIWRQNETEPQVVSDMHIWKSGLRCEPLQLDLAHVFGPGERSLPTISRTELFPPPFAFRDSQRASSGHWTLEMLETIRDNGCRHEILDGRLVVTPPYSPCSLRQRALVHLRTLLEEDAEALGVEVSMGPLNLDLSATNRVIPDLVAYRASPRKRARSMNASPARPCLVVEVLTEHTATSDTRSKRELCQRMGVQEYWIVDLGAREILLWRPEAHKPEVIRKTMMSEPVPGRGGVKIDVARFFRLVLEG